MVNIIYSFFCFDILESLKKKRREFRSIDEMYKKFHLFS